MKRAYLVLILGIAVSSCSTLPQRVRSNTGLNVVVAGGSDLSALARFMAFAGTPCMAHENALGCPDAAAPLLEELAKSNSSITKQEDYWLVRSLDSSRPLFGMADAIAAMENNQTSKDIAIAEMLKSALEKDPTLKTNARLNTRIDALVRAHTSTGKCEVTITEPKEIPFAVGGFDEPVQLQQKCEPTVKTSTHVYAEKSVRFNESHDHSIDIPAGAASSALNVSMLSLRADDNKIHFAPRADFPESFKILSYRGSPTVDVQFIPSTYQIAAVPQFVSEQYQSLMTLQGNFDQSGGKNQLIRSGSEMEANVTSSGAITMGGDKGGKKVDLMFGHPNGWLVDWPGTSYNSISIDGTPYRLRDLRDIVTVRVNESIVETTARIPNKQITVVQRVEARKTGDANGFRITLKAVNSSGASCKIGFRMLMDTWMLDSDDAYSLSHPEAAGNTIQTFEIKFNSIQSPIWETRDIANPRVVFLRHNMLGEGLTPPDEVAFTRWWRSYFTSWEVPVDGRVPVTGDSTAVMWWNPIDVAPAHTREVATDFVTTETKDGLSFAWLGKNTGLLTYQVRDATKTTSVRIEAAVDGGRVDLMLGPESNTVQVRKGDSFTRLIPIFITGLGKRRLTVTERGDGDRVTTFDVDLGTESRAVTPFVWNTSQPFPLQYLSQTQGMKITARVKEAGSGKQIGQASLTEQKIEGGYLYRGTTDLRGFEGTIIVEYFEQ